MLFQAHFSQMFHYAWNYKMLFETKRSKDFLAGVMGLGVQACTWEVKYLVQRLQKKKKNNNFSVF